MIGRADARRRNLLHMPFFLPALALATVVSGVAAQSPLAEARVLADWSLGLAITALALLIIAVGIAAAVHYRRKNKRCKKRGDYESGERDSKATGSPIVNLNDIDDLY